MRSVKDVIQHGWTNSVKCSMAKAENAIHRHGKWLVCNFLYENSINFATEVTFTNNRRADIFVIDWGIAIEILNTETIKKFKTKKYPIPTLPIEFINTDNYKSELLDILDDLKTCAGSNVDYYIKKFIGESV